MAKNFIQPGKVLTMTAPSGGCASGIVYVFGKIFGVAVTSAAEAAEFELEVGGVFELPKVSAEAWTVGAEIYWDAAAELATTVSTANTKIGVAVLSAANPSGLGVVRLNDAF
ncbi:DUF2190 family protein [Aurantimonas sp. DM33-3]|uniref:DUF2190 family protein n=1 Tax=Aurantimonas sp. DM33-3 TaxID=2766955 RepID=UPI00165294FD|nr:DUF2190 family protein [Aurantimonas sp. DM33-3]MBC6714786.1 DUF2190 family protein [Aurantimonas sp. DM33-3]